MNTYYHIFQHPVFDAIGSALLHSLWQGAVVATLLFLALHFIRKDASELRYILCCAALLVMALLPVATAVQLYIGNPDPAYSEPTVMEFEQGAETTASNNTEAIVLDGNQPTASLSVEPDLPTGSTPTYIQNIQIAWRPFVVSLWFAGMVLMSFRWVNGTIAARRMRKRGVPVYEKNIESVFDALVGMLGVTKKVQLLASIHIDQPMMIGWFKPVVLMPFSMLSAMPLDQVEAILAHELAHVRRHDYLVLMLQTITETLLFYHPAVWWVSKKMTIEREYCCDKMATEVIGNELAYASALASLAQSTNKAGAPSLGANDGRLVDRIRRIVDRSERGARIHKHHFSGWGASLAVVGCMVLLAACLQGVKEPDVEAANELDENVAFSGSLGELYDEAIEALEVQDIVAARDLAEQAGNEGHMCSCFLLFHIYNPDKMRQYKKGGVYQEAIVWGQESDSMQVYWAHRFTEALQREAKAGNKLAMLWAHMAYKPRPEVRGDRPLFSGIEESDSLSTLWFDRALEANNPHAWRIRAGQMMEKGNVEEADALFLKAAKLGDEAAFKRWIYADTARVGQPDPNRYFMIADLAIKHNTPGTRAFLSETIMTLEEQVKLGNEYAIQWLDIAKSMKIPERIEELTDTPEPHWFPEYTTLCDWESDSYYTWFYEPDEG